MWTSKPLTEGNGKTGTPDWRIAAGSLSEGATPEPGLEVSEEGVGMGFLAAGRGVVLGGCANSGIGWASYKLLNKVHHSLKK